MPTPKTDWVKLVLFAITVVTVLSGAVFGYGRLSMAVEVNASDIITVREDMQEVSAKLDKVIELLIQGVNR